MFYKLFQRFRKVVRKSPIDALLYKTRKIFLPLLVKEKGWVNDPALLRPLSYPTKIKL